MMRNQLIALLFALGAAFVASAPALAGSPGPDARFGLLPLGTCEADPQRACLDEFDCEDANGQPGACTTVLSDVAIKGVLTLIADKDTGRVEDTSAIPLTKDGAGNKVPEDFSGTTLTLMLEFIRNGKTVVIAESYRDLGDSSIPDLNIECFGFCFPTWREPAVETRIALPPDGGAGGGAGGGGGGGGGAGGGGGGGQQAGSSGIRIRWTTLPPAAEAKLIDALGLPADSTPFLEMVGEKDIFDRSAEDDVTASVHRLKVTIRTILPES